MVDVGQIVNVAKEGWDIFRQTEPSMEVHNSTANAIPHGARTDQLSGPGGTSWYTFGWHTTGWWPDSTTDIRLKLLWSYGARYNGGGAFIPNAWFEVISSDVGWNCKVDIKCSTRNPENRGSDTAPVAYLPMSVTVKEETWTDEKTHTWTFGLYGTGRGEVL